MVFARAALFRVLPALAIALSVWLGGALPAHAQECPEGAQKVGEDATQVHCKCAPGRVLVGSKCVLAEQAEAAQERRSTAQQMKGMVKGLEASLSAWAREAKAAGQGELNEKILEDMLPRIAAVLSLKDDAMALIGFDALAKVRDFLDEYPDCSFEGAKLKATCNSARRFVEMAQQRSARYAELPK